MKERIAIMSKKLPEVAMRASTGKLMGNYKQSGVLFEAPKVEVLSVPTTPWSSTVDSVESEFAPEYDSAEYEAYPVLAMMGLFELRNSLSAFGVPVRKQNNYNEAPLRNKKILVIGTGPGREVIALSALGANVTGFDATKEYVDITAKKVETASNLLGINLPVSLFQSPAESFPYEPGISDGAISLFGVLNHVEDWEETIDQISRALKPGGKFVFSMYGTNDALVFLEMKKNPLLKPSVIQRRVAGGLLLGEDSGKVLPAKFPTPGAIRKAIVYSGFSLEQEKGYLRIAALFPEVPTPENIEEYMKLIEKIDIKAFSYISKYKKPDEVLLAAVLYDKRNQDKIDEFAYVSYIAKKK